MSDQQPRASPHRAALRERPESAGARGERRPAVLFGVYTEHAGGAAHHQHTAGGKEEVGGGLCNTENMNITHTHSALHCTYADLMLNITLHLTHLSLRRGRLHRVMNGARYMKSAL